MDTYYKVNVNQRGNSSAFKYDIQVLEVPSGRTRTDFASTKLGAKFVAWRIVRRMKRIPNKPIESYEVQ